VFKIKSFTTAQASKLEKLKKLCEIEMGWDPPQEYLDEWIKAVLGIYHQDPNLVKIALINQQLLAIVYPLKSCITMRASSWM